MPAKLVIGPLGEALKLSDLPSSQSARWTPRRKAELVAAVRGELVPVEAALERYRLTLDEFLSWERAIEKRGLRGLRVTRLQRYRDADERRRTR
jgi:hypothetical protein